MSKIIDILAWACVMLVGVMFGAAAIAITAIMVRVALWAVFS